MVSFCALHDIEAEEKTKEARKVEWSTSTTVDLDEPWAQVHLRAMGSEQEQR